MFIDLHSHSTLGSDDSTMGPNELVEQAQKVGLGGICITEHGNKQFPLAAEMSRKHNFLVIGGLEAGTELGDILIFGVETYPRTITKAADLRRFIVEAGGVMVAAHPFRYELSPKPWLDRHRKLTVEEACGRKIFQLVDAIEVVNGWATEDDVAFALEVSQRLGLGGSGGSDAHSLYEVGVCYTAFDDGVPDEEHFLRALKSGRFRAVDRRPKALKSPLHTFSWGEDARGS